jgi:hypothetical protein
MRRVPANPDAGQKSNELGKSHFERGNNCDALDANSGQILKHEEHEAKSSKRQCCLAALVFKKVVFVSFVFFVFDLYCVAATAA